LKLLGMDHPERPILFSLRQSLFRQF